MTFYDRGEELATLTSAAESEGHSFVVLYGRRRVGKTELLKAFLRDRPHLYYLAAQESETRQRVKFVEQVATAFDDRVPRIDERPRDRPPVRQRAGPPGPTKRRNWVPPSASAAQRRVTQASHVVWIR